MMSLFLHSFLLISSAVVFSGKVFVHRGELVLLFRNTDYLAPKVALYINEYKTRIHIVTWTIKNELPTAVWNEKKYSKIYMDFNGNVMISDVDESYQGKYSVNNSPSPEVELIIFEKRLTHSGELVLLFKNVSEPDKEVSLFISKDKSYTHVVTWMIQDENIKGQAAWKTTNYPKISMDANRNILIRSVDENYKGKYFIFNSQRLGVELIILDKNVHLELELTVLHVTIAVLSAMLILIFITAVVRKIEIIIRNRHEGSQQMNHDIPPTGTLLPRSSPDSAENVIRETQRRLRQMRHVILPTEGLLPRSSPNSPENFINEDYRRSHQMSHDIPPTENLLPRSSRKLYRRRSN